MKAAAAILLLLASPALAQHKPVPIPAPPPPCSSRVPRGSPCIWAPAPECTPNTAPYAACTWPSTAHVMALPEFDGVTLLPTGRIGRVVAIIEGPILVPLLPGAMRTLYEAAVAEEWMACTPAGVVTANWRKSEDIVLTHLFCNGH